jgi:hypothetical protein
MLARSGQHSDVLVKPGTGRTFTVLEVAQRRWYADLSMQEKYDLSPEGLSHESVITRCPTGNGSKKKRRHSRNQRAIHDISKGEQNHEWTV